MIVKDIKLNSLLPLITELQQIKEETKEAVKSGKMRELFLSSNSDSILSQYSVSIDAMDLTVFDLELIGRMASSAQIKMSAADDGSPDIVYKSNPYPDFIKLQEVPDVFNYIKELASIVAAIDSDQTIKPEDRDIIPRLRLLPIGSYKFEARFIFTGVNILSLFGGLFDESIDKISANDNGATFEANLGTGIYTTFVHSTLTYANKDMNRAAFLEDLMNESRYEYLPSIKESTNATVLSQIDYRDGILNFLGSGRDHIKNGFESISNIIKSSKDNYLNFSVNLICRFELMDMMLLKIFFKEVKYTSMDSYERLFNLDMSKLAKPNIPEAVSNRYINRIIVNTVHYEECKKVILSTPLLNSPQNKYGILYGSTPCRCMITGTVEDFLNFRDNLKSDKLFGLLRDGCRNSIISQIDKVDGLLKSLS